MISGTSSSTRPKQINLLFLIDRGGSTERGRCYLIPLLYLLAGASNRTQSRCLARRRGSSMFRFSLIVVLMAGVGAAMYFAGADERVEQMRYAVERIEAQDKILAELVSTKDATVIELARDWREAFPEPSPSKLSELREIQQLIKNDRRAAGKMTLAYRRANNPLCNGTIQSVLVKAAPECAPGI